jgi:cell wall-associated NlpC family hydrolase
VTSTPQRAKHRAARRPLTSLDDLASAATGSIATVGRRSAIVAAASGMVISTALPAAAAPSENRADAVPSVDTSALTAPVREALATSPTVAVPEDVAWSFASPKIEVKENPKPVVVARSTTTTARSTSATRTKVANNPIPQSVSGNAVLEIAARYVGVPYVHGGSSPSGFDCSGFTQYVYGQLGIKLPRTTTAQRNAGQIISRSDALPGDLIWSPGHVAIYAGGNLQIDAPRPGKTVQFRAIWQSSPVFVRVTG